MMKIAGRMERFVLNHIQFSVIFIYNLVISILASICWSLIPFLLSYCPNYNEISNKIGTSTTAQYVVILLFIIIASVFVLSKTLKGMDEWSRLSLENESDLKKIAEIRDKCINLPYKIFWKQIVVANISVVLITVFVGIVNQVSIIISIRIMMITVSLTSVASVILYTIYRRIFKVILLRTYTGIENEGERVGIKKAVFMQIVPLITTTMLIIALVGMDRLIDERADDVYTIYSYQVRDLIRNTGSFEDSEQVMRLFGQIKYRNTRPVYYVKTSDSKITTSDNSDLGQYLQYFIDHPYNSERIFGLDIEKQGFVAEIATQKDGVIKAGVVFRVISTETAAYYLICIFVLILVNVLTLYYVSKTLSDDISEVTKGFNDIVGDEELDKGKKLSVTSNDEIGDLVIAFNKIRERQLEYDKLKNEFMANISHELRTPINVMFSAIQLLELYTREGSTESADKVRKHLAIVKQNCLRLTRLINNLIDTTRIEAGFLKLQVQPLNIVSLIREITGSVVEYAESRSILLSFETETNEKIINCDADKTERILLNLLSNAIKFTKPGGTISVKIYDREDHILISVKDTGIGIPKCKQEIIFERFRQVEQSLVRNYEGSGIGLSLVKHLVEMHGGKIEVHSEEGAGSEFIVQLPVQVQLTDKVSPLNKSYIAGGQVVDKIRIELSDIYLLNQGGE